MRSAMTLYEIPASDIFMINSSSSGVMYETVLSGGRSQSFARSFIILLRIVLAGRPSSFPICPEVMPDLTHSSIARSSSLVQIITEKPVMPTPSGKKNATPRDDCGAWHMPAEGGRGWGRSEAVVRNFRTTRYARGKDRSSCGGLLDLLATLAMQREQAIAKRPAGLFASAAQQPGDVALSGFAPVCNLRLRQAGGDDVLND